MCAHAPCVRQRYDLGPTPLCGLGGERLGRSVAISINCPASPESPKGPQEAAYTPKAISNRLGALLPMVVGCIPVKVSTDKHTH